jgi:hypothetical protein
VFLETEQEPDAPRAEIGVFKVNANHQFVGPEIDPFPSEGPPPLRIAL